MACTFSNMNVTLPPLRTLFPGSSLPSPSPSPSADDEVLFATFKEKSQHDQLYPIARLPFPLSAPSHAQHNRRVSTSSTSSAPSLTYSPSPSPSPPPSRPASPPQPFLLVPCSLDIADAVVVIAGPPSSSPPSPSSASSPAASPRIPASRTFRICKPSEAKATLLIGPAISAHARKNAANGERRMHPYRIVRERRA